ncbi:MAG TPA: ABC transporter permease [Phytomonospora sp.]
MRRALRAEWTKLRTVPSTPWLLFAAIAATVALAAGAAAVAVCRPDGCGRDLAVFVQTGVRLGQAPIAILAVLGIGGEYGSGLLGTTFAAMPRRTGVLVAKALVLAAAVVAAATVAVLGAMTAGSLILPGDQAASEASTLRSAGGSVLYLGLIALLGLGIAAVVRDAAAGVGVLLGLLYLLPILAQVIGDPAWRRVLARITPTSAELGVTAAWAVAALVLGGVLLKERDVGDG